MPRPGRLRFLARSTTPRIWGSLWAPLLAAVLSTGGCSSSAHADRVVAPPGAVGGPRIALAISPAKVRAPYDVQVINDGGETLPTFAHRDRFYVQGAAGERYIIRIANPTPNRIEAVVSVDGLDVVDGEAGDLHKRGYVVPPYGETRIEGFRTSAADVATFRFSAVDDSYAGRKGKARNVGVIAVALFEAQAPEPDQALIIGGAGDGYRGDGYVAPYDDDGDMEREESAPPASRDRGPAPTSAPAAPPPRSASKRAAAAEADAPASRPSGGAGASRMMTEDLRAPDPMPVQQRRSRPGLGTEFGEQRSSAASFTQFVRAPGRPVAIAELRYNDTAGLVALGIPVAPVPDEGELMTRETADPFPGDTRFATPPR